MVGKKRLFKLLKTEIVSKGKNVTNEILIQFVFSAVLSCFAKTSQ